MTVREDLIAAKALITPPEMWVKHPGSVGECYCAITSLTGLFGGTNNQEIQDRKRAAWVALAEALPTGWATVGSFNDAPDTTHADILALFDRAIEAAE